MELFIFILFDSTSAYFVGCKVKKAAPKQAEKVGVGLSTPLSVPASFAVKPDKKWYWASSLLNIDTAGKTPKASAVKKITLLAWPPFEIGWTILSIW